MAINYIKQMNNNTPHNMNWKMLQTATRLVSVPFSITLQESPHPLICEEIIRILPRKRIVAFGTWNNKNVVAKLFFERSRAKNHRVRESKGIHFLNQASIPTPTLLFEGASDKNKIQVMIFERIYDADSLQTVWEESHAHPEIVELMQAMTIELATQHVLGITQHDLHFKNFLVSEKKIYTLDGDGIERTLGPLPKKESIENLALFFSQLGVGTEQLQKILFKEYTKARGWLVKKSDHDLLHQSIKKSHRLRWELFRKKIERNCSAFARIDKFSSSMMYDINYHSNAFLQFLKNPDEKFSHPHTTIIKSGKTATVAEIKIDQHILVVKRYNVKNAGHWLRRCFRKSRAAKSWRLSHQLRLFGIPTAKPIAYIENHVLGLRGKSYFIMEKVQGEHAGMYFEKYRTNENQFRQAAQNIISLLKSLLHLRLTHGDLKMTNILIQDHRPLLIDLDGMVQHKTKWSLQRAFKQEVRRFMKNWEDLPLVKMLFQEL